MNLNLNRGISTPIALTIIISLVVILVGGLFAYQYYVVPEEKTKTSETADWKTYTNEEYGFEFKYPQTENVSLVNHISPSGTELILPGDNFIEKDGSVGNILRFLVFQESLDNLEQYVSSDVNKAQEVNNEFLDKNGNPPVKISYQNININGNDAYKVKYEYLQSDQPTLFRVYIQNSAQVLIFDYNDGDLFADQILSTFKFID